MGLSWSVPQRRLGSKTRLGRHGATGPLSSLQLQWQGAKVNESGSAGGLLTQAARGKRSCKGLLGRGWGSGGGVAGGGRGSGGVGLFKVLPLAARF